MTEGKLTKKQKKALDFKNSKGKSQRKEGKEEPQVTGDQKSTGDQQGTDNQQEGAAHGHVLQDDQRADGAPEQQAKAETDKGSTLEAQVKVKKSKKGKNKLEVPEVLEKQLDDVRTESTASGKRKRSEKDQKTSASKKRFDEQGNVVETAQATVQEEEDDKSEKDRRFIVFVGNMSYKTSTEEIAKHFASHCTETPKVRLLTSKSNAAKTQALSKSKQKSIAKGKAQDPGAPQSKGCAFVEFTSNRSLQKALQYHHTMFQGRSINVELTAGGGGKGQGRKDRIEHKNRELEAERRKLHEKYVKSSKEDKANSKSRSDAQHPSEKKPIPEPAASKSYKNRAATKIPKWAASGSNAIRLSS